MAEPTEKRCAGPCKQVKDLETGFSKGTSLYGRQSHCKQCQKIARNNLLGQKGPSVAQQVEVAVERGEKVVILHRKDFVLPKAEINYHTGKSEKPPNAFENLLERCGVVGQVLQTCRAVKLTWVKAHFIK